MSTVVADEVVSPVSGIDVTMTVEVRAGGGAMAEMPLSELVGADSSPGVHEDSAAAVRSASAVIVNARASAVKVHFIRAP
ncbi:hypothetical protein [Gordonia sihwensis]|uniref:hypothetical protein n=1 Tax=Gordonia sihwensis TaxID=173559 RepID=UPI003D9824EA